MPESLTNYAGPNVLLIAPAKLTTELRVTGVRADGFHVIDAEMVSLNLCDELTVSSGDGLTISGGGSGLEISTNPDNLVARALAFAGLRAAVTVTKRIPAGAGLGGGSSDAAAVLHWAGIDDVDAAVSLGADVGFCLVGGRARVTGIGELIEPLVHVERAFTLLTPPFGVSTPAVYRTWDDLGGPSGVNGNDLEPAALHYEPRLRRWREGLGSATGITPRLAGSGGTWFVDGHHDVEIDGVVGQRVLTTGPRVRDNDPQT